MDQIDILCIIHAQLYEGPWFTQITNHLQGKINEFREGNGFLPDRYNLKNIAITIMDLYSPADKQGLMERLAKALQQCIFLLPILYDQ